MKAKFFTWLALLLLPISSFAQDAPLPQVQDNRPEFLRELETQAEQNGSRFYVEFFKMLVVLGVLVAFLLLLTWFMKRMMNARMVQQNEESDIKILERRSLHPKTHLYMIEVMGRSVLIADSINGVTRLAEFPGEEGQKAPSPKKFTL